jgi:hydroxylaminobenzene mutase
MPTEQLAPRRRLLRHGLTLFAIALVTGLAIPAFANPRAALAGHLEGVLNGMFLMIVGLAWSELGLSDRVARWLPNVLLVGAYLNFAATTATGALGTSMATPLSGAGFSAPRPLELAMFGVFAIIAITMLAVAGALVHAAWRGRR